MLTESDRDADILSAAARPGPGCFPCRDRCRPALRRLRHLTALAAGVALAITSAGATFAFAASSAPGEQLRAALAGLDRAWVPTGVLYDRVVPVAGLPELNGRPGSPAVPSARWRQALHELRLAALDPSAWPTVDEVRARVREAAPRGVSLVHLAVLDVEYDQLVPDALAAGRLQAAGDRLLPTAGTRADQLARQRQAFAAAALEETVYQGAQVAFVLPRRLYVHGPQALPVRFELDAADGLGFRELTLDQPVHVAYAATGLRTARLRATRGALELEGSFRIDVRALATPAPNDTLLLTAGNPYQGGYGTGQAYVYLAPGHAAPVNPVVVVEGFDLDNSMGWDQLYALLNREQLLETLRADGYDALVLDFTESTDFIQRNAFVLVELLQQVEGLSGGHDVSVVGASMGGLVARYALAWMETNGLPHHARSFISFDAPQAGANIPLGLQYWLDFFKGDSTEAAYLLSRLDTPAALQMLLYHHTTPPSATGASDPLRATLAADLAAVGGWPAQPRRVAVANGSGTGADQGYAAGAQLISYQYSSFLVDILGNVWAVPSSSSLRVFQGSVDIIWPLPDRSTSVTVAGTQPYDNAPGGFRASMAQMDTTSVPYGDIVALHPAHCFIPTVSAIALPTADPFFDLAGTPDLASLTPFAAVYLPSENQEHVEVTVQNREWLLAEIRRAPTAAPGLPTAVSLRPALLPARPNPFNPRTVLAFVVPGDGPVDLGVFDARGRRVCTLVQGPLAAGRHEVLWPALDDAGQAVASGVYHTRLQTTAGTATGTLTLVR